MNVGSESAGGSRSQEFDINLAPIIDCFTVLITFMLVSASFLSIGIFDAGAGAAGQASASQTPVEEMVQVDLQSQFGIEIKLTGTTTDTIHLASKNGKLDYEGLSKELSSIKQRWPKTESLILSASNDIEYLHIIQSMEKIRKIIPGVLLGGF
jgi:biopolymer transport protein ExbD